VTVAFPVFQWIPNVDQFTDTGAALLAVIGDSLDSFGRGERYGRRVFSHGLEVPVKIPQSGPDSKGQVLVSIVNVFFGKAGQELFTFIDGQIGKYGFLVVQYGIDVLADWPMPRSGERGVLQQDQDLMSAAGDIWTDGLIVISALRAVALHGITTDPPVAPIAEDNIHVGSMTPKGPAGGLAGWNVHVQIQF
jgi:hypothetical protein